MSVIDQREKVQKERQRETHGRRENKDSKGKGDGKGKPSLKQVSTKEQQGEASRSEGRELKAEGRK